MERFSEFFLLTAAAVVLLLAALPAPPARAQEWQLVTGRVETLVRGEKYIELTLKPDSGTGKTPPVNLEIPVADCPGPLKAGDHVRIWNKTTGSGRTVYRISTNRRCDATGVRQRLRRHGHRSGGRRGGGGGHGGH